VEIILGIISLFFWLGVLLYMLLLAGGMVFYILYVIVGVIFVVLEKMFKKNNLQEVKFSSLERKIKEYEIKSLKEMIKRARNSKIYFYSGIIMVSISSVFEFLFLISVINNENLWSFCVFGMICLFFGIYYLKVHRRFYEKKL